MGIHRDFVWHGQIKMKAIPSQPIALSLPLSLPTSLSRSLPLSLSRVLSLRHRHRRFEKGAQNNCIFCRHNHRKLCQENFGHVHTMLPFRIGEMENKWIDALPLAVDEHVMEIIEICARNCAVAYKCEETEAATDGNGVNDENWKWFAWVHSQAYFCHIFKVVNRNKTMFGCVQCIASDSHNWCERNKKKCNFHFPFTSFRLRIYGIRI